MSTTLRRSALVLVVAAFLHVAVAPHVRVAGVAADVLLLAAVAAGVVAGPDRGAVVGFVAGLVADCFLVTPFGLSALVLCLVGWGVGRLQATLSHVTPWVPVATTLVASAVAVLGFAVVGAVVGEPHLLRGDAASTALVVGSLNALASPLALRAMRWALVVRRPGMVAW